MIIGGIVFLFIGVIAYRETHPAMDHSVDNGVINKSVYGTNIITILK